MKMITNAIGNITQDICGSQNSNSDSELRRKGTAKIGKIPFYSPADGIRQIPPVLDFQSASLAKTDLNPTLGSQPMPQNSLRRQDFLVENMAVCGHPVPTCRIVEMNITRGSILAVRLLNPPQ